MFEVAYVFARLSTELIDPVVFGIIWKDPSCLLFDWLQQPKAAQNYHEGYVHRSASLVNLSSSPFLLPSQKKYLGFRANPVERKHPLSQLHYII